MPPQVPEPAGAGSTIPLPAGDWVTVSRYEEGRKGLDPWKNKRRSETALQRWGGKGSLAEMEGARSLKEKSLKDNTPNRSGAWDRVP